ncbi:MULTISPECIES: DMT family transporter [Rhodomicrobium]|uniref:DMT family transporter n=1 Tax=Rhodomicrobium TaxID=1068 RepID=UPI000B4A7B7A|nr:MULTISPECIES: DMT family transporter [Rhodomicrobium]
MTGFLFSVNVLVWGFSWIAIAVQIRETSAEVALLYRLGLAALVLFLALAATRRLRRVRLHQQPYLALMGLCLFFLNYLLVYNGTSFIPSGVVALVFSTATVFNALNSMLFYGDRQSLRFIFGAVLGMAGLGCLFWRDLTQLDLGSASLIGGALVLAATYVFSLGNMVSRRNNAAGIDLPTATAWSMAWGTLFLAALTFSRGQSLPLDLSWNWYLALFYLAIPGTVIGFLSYLEVVRRLGAPLAAFSTVLYPAIALTVSTFFEGYHWTPAAALGLLLIALGNMLVFAPGRFWGIVSHASRRIAYAWSARDHTSL